jgi:hypothetical protein
MSLTDDVQDQVAEGTIEAKRLATPEPPATSDLLDEPVVESPVAAATAAAPVAPAPVAPTAPAAPTPAPEPSVPSGATPDAVEPPEEPDEPEDPTASPQDRAAKTRLKLQKRVDKLTAQKSHTEGERDTERARANRLERELAELRGGTSPAPKADETPVPTAADLTGADPNDPEPLEPTKPTENDTHADGTPRYADYDELEAAVKQFEVANRKYTRDLAAWSGRQETRRLFATRDAAEHQARENQQVFTQFRERMETTKKAHADFDAVVTSDLPANGVMEHVIFTSPVGPEISYYLGQHREECIRLANMVSADPSKDPATYNRQVADCYREMFELAGEVRAMVRAVPEAAGRPAAPSAAPASPHTPPGAVPLKPQPAPAPIGHDRVVSLASGVAVPSDDQSSDDEWLDKVRRERYGGRS